MIHDIHKWEKLPFPKSLPQFQKLFPNDAACARYLEGAKWPDGFQCPHCKARGESVRIAARPLVLACRKCRKQTSLTVGTVMERAQGTYCKPCADERIKQAEKARAKLGETK